jgi:hypothetical protein
MTEPRLPRRTVLRHLDRLADDLAPRQLDRLRALADLIDEDGRIPLARASASSGQASAPATPTPTRSTRNSTTSTRQTAAAVRRSNGSQTAHSCEGL